MIEAGHTRKNKIQLSDYSYERDIQNRLLLAEFSSVDLQVLEEILYNSTKIPKKRLLTTLEISEKDLQAVLEKFSQIGLLTQHDQIILVDKELRKYFELQIKRFDPNFRADMDFLQTLLKSIPIHVLPNWYAIPRSSNNIFESIVEKYLKTPQIFQRYLVDLFALNPIYETVVRDTYASSNFSIPASVMQEKLQLSTEKFEELLILLELSFVCSIQFIEQAGAWEKMIIPFHEWKTYMNFFHTSKCTTIQEPDAISPKRPGDFPFIRDMSFVLKDLQEKPIKIEIAESEILISQESLETLAKDCGYFDLSNPVGFLEAQTYLTHVIEKLCMIDLVDCKEGKLLVLPEANNWLTLSLQDKALYLYRHPSNQLLSHNLPEHLLQERYIREIEKTIQRVSQSGWVYFDDFTKGVIVPLNENATVELKKAGRYWEYALPQYTDDEKEFIRSVILEWLYEVGMVNVGTHQGKDCFTITGLGQSLFEDLPIFANL